MIDYANYQMQLYCRSEYKKSAENLIIEFENQCKTQIDLIKKQEAVRLENLQMENYQESLTRKYNCIKQTYGFETENFNQNEFIIKLQSTYKALNY